MANKFWVGGSDDWNGTAGSKWASVSGGAGGQAVPTSSDDVFFDANSGANTVTVTTFLVNNTLNLDFTGFTGTFTSPDSVKSIGIYGSLILGIGMTNSFTGTFYFNSGSAGTITSNGVHFGGRIIFQNLSGITLLDNFFSTGQFYFSSGIFDANNFNITCESFFSSESSARTLTMGSGTWTITGSGTVWDTTTTTNLTLNANTSTLKFTGTSDKIFIGGGLTYNNFWNSGSGVMSIQSSNTFSNFKSDAGKNIHFTDGTTQTITTLTLIGTVGNLIGLMGSSTGGWTISDTTGTNTVDYCNISYSIATGGATFNASNSTDGGNNSGWNFITGASTGNMFAVF